MKTRVVAAIPCYNTQEHIAEVITETKKYVDEVIVIDDGSTDKTAEVARKAGATVLRHPKNRGKGAAMKTAAATTDADIIVFIDGDGQHNPDDIPDILVPILQGQADFVIGSRYLKGSILSANPFFRKAANAIASLVISFVISVLQPLARFISRRPKPTGLQIEQHGNNMSKRYRLVTGKFKWISDCTSGFTAMSKTNWDKLDLVSDRYQIETEVIYEQAKNGFVIAEMPISCIWGKSGTKLSIIRDGLLTLAMLIYKLFHYSKSRNSKLKTVNY